MVNDTAIVMIMATVMVTLRHRPTMTSDSTYLARIVSGVLPGFHAGGGDDRTAQPYTPRGWSRTILPLSISTTRRRIWFTMLESWVTMTTVVPVRLIRSSRRRISIDV